MRVEFTCCSNSTTTEPKECDLIRVYGKGYWEYFEINVPPDPPFLKRNSLFFCLPLVFRLCWSGLNHKGDFCFPHFISLWSMRMKNDTKFRIFQQFIQQLHRHFLKKCAAFIWLMFDKCGNQSFFDMHMVSAQIRAIGFCRVTCHFCFFLKITQLWIQQLKKFTNNQFKDIHNNRPSVWIKT